MNIFVDLIFVVIKLFKKMYGEKLNDNMQCIVVSLE